MFIKIILDNDNWLLVSLIKETIDEIKNNCLRRLKIKNLPYTFLLKYVPGQKFYISDLLSINIVYTNANDYSETADVVQTVQIAPELLISTKHFKLSQRGTLNDEGLSVVLENYNNGWPKSLHNIKTFF